MPFFRDIIGQDRGVKILQSFLEREAYPPTLLFVGREGIGKKAIAHAFAQALFCQDRERSGGSEKGLIEPCGRCLSCRKVIDKNHPDLSMIEPDGKVIKIDQIRALEDKIIFKPIEGDKQVILIDPADRMNTAAANGLLKTLEEPPPYVVMILIASKPASFPETLLSRCQKISFSPISPSQMALILKEKREWTSEEARLVATLAGGRIGEALSMEVETAKALEEERNALVSEETLRHYENLFEVAAHSSRDADVMEKTLSYLMEWFRDVLAVQSLPDPTQSAPSRLAYSWRYEALRQWAGRMRPDEVWKFLEEIHEIRMAQSRNINRQLALETLLIKLRDVLGGNRLEVS